MQLKKIKLSGFKSFVDPTTIHLPSHLVAIVGPNGCGKSNIIDAICWVMGESSAKYLRGESLTDVIFNGSSARKPVGQASIELVFDNQDGSLGGEYGSYAEIAIKRLITREGESSYYLNNGRCRRRDIIDIFLGTGLGPRSYSIIGQNMISRIIESKPDEMRIYMEEAAGVSKYKDRRRETENRIQHTKENLARLNDIRLELDKQLSSLQRQANAAEKYKTLKHEERVMRSQCLAIQWRQLDALQVQNTLHIQQQETGLEARHSQLTDLDRTLERNRNEQHAANDVFQEIQRRYYTVGNEITRIEQDIHHNQERQRHLQANIEQVHQEREEVQQAFADLEEELQQLTAERAQLEPDAQKSSEVVSMLAAELSDAEEAVQAWQTRWDEFNQYSANTTQTAQVEQTRIQHLDQKIVGLTQRQEKLQQEQAQFDFSQLETELAELNSKEEELAELTEERDEQLQQVRKDIAAQQQFLQETRQRLDTVRRELQQLSGQHTSLDALQQTALGQRNNPALPWLTTHKLDKQPRLAQKIQVEAGWEEAAEKVLAAYLQAICVDNLEDIAAKTNELTAGNLCIFGNQGKAAASDHPKAVTLLSKIKSAYPLHTILSGIYVADTLQDALELSASLESHESVITAQGIWLGSAWLRVARDENPAAGVFQREQELKELAEKLETLYAQTEELEQHISAGREKLNQLENQREQLQQEANQFHTKCAEVQAQHKIKQDRLSTLKNRAQSVTHELNECTTELERAQTLLTTARTTWQDALKELEQNTAQRNVLIDERDNAREHLQMVRVKMNEAKDRAHQMEIRLQTTLSQQASQKQTLAHMQTQLSALSKRQDSLNEELQTALPLDALTKNLNAALAKRLLIEEELTAARASMESVDQELNLLESKRQEMERDLTKVRDALGALRMEWQGHKVKCEALLDQIKETGFILEEILKVLPDEATASEWQSQLEHITQRINRLGAINLVAIEEYATCSERKQYLDKQNDDLMEGLTTLENAIAKIDKETRAKFKETFDKVNERFQELFPKIFGGGRAYLELTGDNLLDAGITVMASPPGKRNSTINLLSGGEKAMTAIALVFSIFHLNPAPFCLLDEVDAPLDDANIGRFCDLVKTMSEKTQFIFISHNKLAIEMAQHLIGVTMNEPGVSRLVSVNIEEAINLAGA